VIFFPPAVLIAETAGISYSEAFLIAKKRFSDANVA
jgi:hypothetical protein